MPATTSDFLKQILSELESAPSVLSDEETETFVSALLEARRIFVAGAGRSGLMAKAFAMRLGHMGFDSYVIGETVTPGYSENDLLVFSSGSGETKSLIAMAEKAGKIGGKMATVTLSPDSTLGKAAHVTVTLPGTPKENTNEARGTIQPMGSLYEQTLLLFYDAVILRIMGKKDLNTGQMFGRHANLE